MSFQKNTKADYSPTGEYIRQVRNTKGLTQEQLARYLGVNYTTVNRWENGHHEPSPMALRLIKSLEE